MFLRVFERTFHLAQNFGFAQNEGIEAARDLKQMARGGFILKQGEMVFRAARGAERVNARHRIAQQSAGFGIAPGVNFDAIASGQNRGFAHARNRFNVIERVFQTRTRHGKTLAHFDGRGFVIESNQMQMRHD